jgi:hypothetical protein
MCSPSYVDFRPKTNAVILMDIGLMQMGEHTHEEREREEVQNMKVMCPLKRSKYSNPRSLWEGDQEVVNRSGRDESIWAVIYMLMETMLGVSLYSYPISN